MSENKDWSQYWSQGHKTSFGSSFKGCYEGVLKQSWLKVFSTFNDGDKVLDLCTGNGSLPRLAYESMSNFSEINFSGVDYATVDSDDTFLKLSNVDFKFDCNIEELPFDSLQFDYVISNYGIEYSNLEKSLTEVSRVLKPLGKATFVCHVNSSRIFLENANELTLLTYLLKSDGLINCLDSLVTALDEKAVTQDTAAINEISMSAEQYRNELNKQLSDALDEFGIDFHQSDFVSFLKFLLNKNTENKKDKLALYKQEAVSHQVRLKALCKAALNYEALPKTIDLFNSVGLEIHNHEMISDESGIVAIQIWALKIV
ncbi:class I SAM-dependent methyltransferase [Litorilituus lipolyticus]|uniref:Class I SAM-dependent methyltransferase n=1 Tax=Litorilituus lipolyticus TaxID=2491017 RepID=A0A502L8F1_9GAMM|nr:class I SAM-dependent methyltransferase [Litorilituus lipolyticus]TPH19159.1 class I SAM-dependent methyltransferase [Litorilituus lipolyticus]